MFDEKLLDRMTFGELNEGLEYIIERIDEIEDESTRDALIVIANKIIMQMDAIIRENGRSNPQALAQWTKAMDGYAEGFAKYKEFLPKEDTPSDSTETS